MRLFVLVLAVGVVAAQTADEVALWAKRAAALAAQGKPEAAAAEYERVLAYHRKTGDQFRVGVVLNNLGAAWLEAGEPDRAMGLFDEALAIRTERKDQLGIAYTLLGHANVHWYSGEPQRALDSYRRVVAIAGAEKNDGLLAHALNNGGLVLQALGEDTAALGQHEQAIGLFRKLAQRIYEGYAVNNAGMALMNLGRRTAARERFEAALAIFRESQDSRSQAYALHNLGDLTLRERRPAEAIPYYRQSLEQKRSARDRYGEAWSLARLAEANLELGDPSGAAMLLQQALHVHRTVGDRSGEASTLALLARAERNTGDTTRAIQHLEEALRLVERTRGSIATPELRGSYFATRQSIYEFLTTLLVEQKDPRALEVSERARARLLLDNLAGDPKLEALRRSIQATGQRLQRARTPAESEAGRNRLLQLEAEAAKFPMPERGRPRTLAELQALNGENSAVLEYWLGEERSALFVIRRDGVKVLALPARKSIEGQAAALLTALTARGAEAGNETPAARKQRLAAADAAWPSLSAALGKLLWPGGELAGVNRVLIVPHRGLAHLPFWLLPGTERVRITTIPSASLLPFLGTRSHAASMAIYAAPRMSGGLAPLPFSRAEGESIAKLAGPGTILRTGAEAAMSPALGRELARHRYLHFATHVELSGNRPQMELSDSRLTPDDVYNFTLDADLVTLSACRTAAGRELSGEGLLSFSHAFLYAGANRVMATQWSVDDQATAAFMRLFYESLLTRQRTPGEALADAREGLRKQARWAHPWYWAGFTLIGQWQ